MRDWQEQTSKEEEKEGFTYIVQGWDCCQGFIWKEKESFRMKQLLRKLGESQKQANVDNLREASLKL